MRLGCIYCQNVYGTRESLELELKVIFLITYMYSMIFPIFYFGLNGFCYQYTKFLLKGTPLYYASIHPSSDAGVHRRLLYQPTMAYMAQTMALNTLI